MEDLRVEDTAVDEYVPFHAAGSAAKGEYHCAECGYGVTVYKELPVCPMCASGSWELAGWSPLTRALAAQLQR